jgi:YjbE family integral membrane protein
MSGVVAVDQLGALVSVVIIDLVLAGDNAIVLGMAAALLPKEQRRRVIGLGVAAAIALRIVFAYFAAEILAIIGLTLAGGVLLLWVSWKVFRELREAPGADLAAAVTRPEGGPRRGRPGRALTRIVVADVSMSLDNILAVAGTARDHLWVLVFGLVLSVALTAIASTYVARLLGRHPWISWLGLGVVTFVALRMVWSGSAEILDRTTALSWRMT